MRPEDPADEGRTLLQAAYAIQARAHAPYSGFRVGAALLDEQGRLHVGVNVENASYGLTLCAERVAVFNAIAAGARRIRALGVVGHSGRPLPPCGACRQVLAELADPDCSIWLDGGTAGPQRHTLSALLPLAFQAAELMDPSSLP
ncbi:cytidine deaminase [Aquariibacter albus]|uniref:Cytidine deaminase n=1 Tax=Aquariibacter albus TaxID=2759899 RepID=A0A839HLT6_9BURK|nr:cytidine deaminase [Aquariibacter albus]MBB1162292.1 cytidine deaminase [Aquariibacter albus]